MTSSLSDRLLAWYAACGRVLPWRGLRDPYAIWVSETILQQTRVETAIPFFNRWMARFPTVFDLAAATEAEVLRAWEGLGYYRRAHHLHQAARLVCDRYGGQLPSSVTALRQLPGIGAYTAGAIASMAFGQDEPAIDGNALRVFARLFDIADPLGSAACDRRIRGLVTVCLPSGRAGKFNQALMDLGAMVCLPRHPRCDACPLQAHCAAYRLGVQANRPVRRPKPSIPTRHWGAVLLWRGAEVAIARRDGTGLLGGLWEFPGVELTASATEAERLAALQRSLSEDWGVDAHSVECLSTLRHAYSHFRVVLHAYRAAAIADPQPHSPLLWVAPSVLSEYPMGKLARAIARMVVQERQDLRSSSPQH